MAEVLRALGAGVRPVDGPDGPDLVIDGIGGPPTGDADVYCGMAGTVGRFIVPMLAAGAGRFTVDAHPQLRRRPLGPVLAALRAQGAVIDGESLPLTVTAAGLRGGAVDVDASISSQFLSGLLMAAPFARAPSSLRFGALVSAPYLELTVDVMRAFGVEVQRGDGALSVAPASVSGDGARDRARRLDRVVLPRQRRVDADDRDVARPRSRRDPPGRHRARVASSSGWAVSSAPGRRCR